MFNSAHNQPGRRFASGSNRHDHMLGAFGFLAHAMLFFSLGMFTGAIAFFVDAEYATWAFLLIFGGSQILLVVRGMMVGLSTTKESVAAIWKAWSPWASAVLILGLSWQPADAQLIPCPPGGT